MAWNNRKLVKTFKTDTDLSAKKYFIVKLNSDDDAVLAGSGEDALGVLTEDVADGSSSRVYVSVCLEGITEVSAGGTITADGLVMSDASGEAVAATSGNYVVGRALEDAVNGDIIPILLAAPGSQLN